MEKEHKDLLRTLHLNLMKESTPNAFIACGGYTMKTKPFNDETANGLARCIETFVRGQYGYFNRINTTGMMRKIGNEMKWTKGNSNKGAADCRIVFKGKSIDVEIKIGNDKLSEAQEKEMERIINAGGLVFVARDFPSFLKGWQSCGFDVPEIITTIVF